MELLLKEVGTLLIYIHDSIHLISPHWILKPLEVILDLNKLTKKNTHPIYGSNRIKLCTYAKLNCLK